jgi:hypothetical protein
MRPALGERVESRGEMGLNNHSAAVDYPPAVSKNKPANQSRHDDDFPIQDYLHHRPVRVELWHLAIRLGVENGSWVWPTAWGVVSSWAAAFAFG